MTTFNKSAGQLAFELREDLRSRLIKLRRPLEDHNRVTAELSSMGVQVNRLDPADAVSSLASQFLNDLASRLTEEYKGVGDASVTFGGDRGTRAPSGKSFFLSRHDCLNYFGADKDMNESLTLFLNSFPLLELAKDAIRQCEGLEEFGLRTAATSLAGTLHLIDYGNGSAVKTTKRRFVSYYTFRTCDGFGYSYEVHRDLDRIAQQLKIVEAEMGDLGGSAAFEELAATFKETNAHFPSRTVLQKDRCVEAVVFNGHMDIRLSHDLADTLLAFLTLYCDKPLINLKAA